MGSRVREKIISELGEKLLSKSATRQESSAAIFKSVLAGKGYKTILEIGTFRGCSAAVMSEYCERLVTIDLIHGMLENKGQTFDRRAFWNSLGITNIELRLIRSDIDKTNIVNAMNFDFAFIDGAHDETVNADFALVERCGKVLFHDYTKDGRPDHDHVSRLVDSLPQNEVTIMGDFALWIK